MIVKVIIWVVVLFFVAPVVTYCCVKFGTVAFYAGRDFHKKQKGDDYDGKEDE